MKETQESLKRQKTTNAIASAKFKEHGFFFIADNLDKKLSNVECGHDALLCCIDPLRNLLVLIIIPHRWCNERLADVL